MTVDFSSLADMNVHSLPFALPNRPLIFSFVSESSASGRTRWTSTRTWGNMAALLLVSTGVGSASLAVTWLHGNQPVRARHVPSHQPPSGVFSTDTSSPTCNCSSSSNCASYLFVAICVRRTQHNVSIQGRYVSIAQLLVSR